MSESSSPFDQHHEFLDFFLQSFSFEQKAKHHVEESSGKKGRRRTFDSGTEVDMFDIKRFERESISHVGFGYIMQPKELPDWVGIPISQTLRNRRETASKTHRRVLVCDTEKTICFQASRDRCERQDRVHVLGHQCVEYRINLQRKSWITTIFRFPIIGTSRKFSKFVSMIEISTPQTSFQNYHGQLCHSTSLCRSGWTLWKGNSSDSIVSVWVSSKLNVTACDLSTLEELTTSPFSGESSWSCQGSST